MVIEQTNRGERAFDIYSRLLRVRCHHQQPQVVLSLLQQLTHKHTGEGGHAQWPHTR